MTDALKNVDKILALCSYKEKCWLKVSEKHSVQRSRYADPPYTANSGVQHIYSRSSMAETTYMGPAEVFICPCVIGMKRGCDDDCDVNIGVNGDKINVYYKCYSP